jgi:hypothetical protein
MPLCTRNDVSGPLADAYEAVYSGKDKITSYFPLSHFTDVWDQHVRVVFNLPPQHPLCRGVASFPSPCPSTPCTRRASEETLAKATRAGDVRGWLQQRRAAGSTWCVPDPSQGPHRRLRLRPPCLPLYAPLVPIARR